MQTLRDTCTRVVHVFADTYRHCLSSIVSCVGVSQMRRAFRCRKSDREQSGNAIANKNSLVEEAVGSRTHRARFNVTQRGTKRKQITFKSRSFYRGEAARFNDGDATRRGAARRHARDRHGPLARRGLRGLMLSFHESPMSLSNPIPGTSSRHDAARLVAQGTATSNRRVKKKSSSSYPSSLLRVNGE